MHALGPAVAQFLLQRPAREIRASRVEKVAELVRARHPDHHRRGVGDGAKTRLALPQRFLASFARGDVHGHTAHAEGLAGTVEFDPATRDYPTGRTVREQDAVFALILAIAIH